MGLSKLLVRDEPAPEGMDKIDYSLGDKLMSLDDLIIDESDKHFAKLIKSFDASASAFDRLRHQFFSKVGHLLKDYIKSDKISMRSSLLATQSEHSADEQRLNLVSAIDDFLSSSSDGDDSEEVEGEAQLLSLVGAKKKPKYGVVNRDGSVTEMKKRKKAWWKISAHQFKKFVVGCLIVGALVVTLIVLL